VRLLTLSGSAGVFRQLGPGFLTLKEGESVGNQTAFRHRAARASPRAAVVADVNPP
jgi:hypothetical protein